MLMPETDGYVAIRKIRDLESNISSHKIPVIAMAALTMEGSREKCLKSGRDDYLTRPIYLHDISDILERLC